MVYIYRRPWRRLQPLKKFVKNPPVFGSAANTIGPFVSVGVGNPGVQGAAAGTIADFVSAGAATVYKTNFVPGVVVGAVNPCLQKVIPSYLYQEYQDDQDLQAFVYAQNTVAQAYVDWLNALNLPVYTSSFITGALLDWVAAGLYGVSRPVLVTGTSKFVGPLNTYTFNSLELDAQRDRGTHTFTPVNDDIFKRVLTWKLYKGDGKVINIRWLKRRIIRFLFGANGTDVDTTGNNPVSVSFSNATVATLTVVTNKFTQVTPGSLIGNFRLNRAGYNRSRTRAVLTQTLTTYTHGIQINITVDSTMPNAATFKEAIEQGVLDMPFQFKTTVTLV